MTEWNSSPLVFALDRSGVAGVHEPSSWASASPERFPCPLANVLSPLPLSIVPLIAHLSVTLVVCAAVSPGARAHHVGL